MADRVPKSKKPAVTYTMEVDESGAMRRVPVRPAIVSAAVTAAATQRKAAPPPPPPPPPVEENLVFGDEGEVLTGEARAAAVAATEKKEEVPVVVNENEEVYGNNGELLTGEARAAALRAVAEQNQRDRKEQEAREKACPACKAAKKSRKELKKAVEITEADDIEKMKLFYRYRAKNTTHFVYTAEGNLEIKEGNAAKIPAMVIPLRAFNALTLEELEEIESEQKRAQAEIEESYVTKMRELRTAYDAYNPRDEESAKQIVLLNEQLRQISVTRNMTIYPERWVTEIGSIDTRDILLHLPHEERKLGYPVYLFKRFDLAKKDAEGHYRQHGEGALESMEGGGTVVLFLTNPEDQKTGHFHPAAEREFVYNETRYVSPYQAFETERFKEFEDETMVKRLLGTRSAKTIRSLIAGEKRQPSFPVKLWEEILEAFYTQFKDAADRLKETGSARFHMMDKIIGSPEYANALANVRTKLKERENDAVATADVVKQSVITEDEQKKAKVGAIINNLRRF